MSAPPILSRDVSFLSLGFRPFFLAAGLWAALAMGLWLPWLIGAAEAPTAFAPVDWHVHEMLFGYAGAAVAGFLLTAVPNWTGQPPLVGAPLLALAGLWALGRLAILTSAGLGGETAAVLDVALPILLALWTARALMRSGNRRNLVVVGLVLLLALASALHHAGALGLAETTRLGQRLGIATYVMMISLIGGRIIPTFTRNWLSGPGKTTDSGLLPPDFGAVDRAALILTALTLAAWVADLGLAWAPLALAAGLAQALRLGRWRGWATRREPLLIILHLGYVWLPIGLILLAAAGIGLLPEVAAAHALGVGAFGTMILAVMTRAILGHTGRPLRAGPATTALFALLLAAVILRVLSAALPDLGLWALHASASLWILAHLGFLILYGPMLLRKRIAGV
ncbi:protein NnrS [Rhodospirillum rubrum]|nr:NnrS family protein [Rhodospirillum rubrum]MBK1666311.1 protein NnrS [Rhodospirillum rubrum]MBK1678493.1 protein NnrS [Rhodospirillum rubrum]